MSGLSQLSPEKLQELLQLVGKLPEGVQTQIVKTTTNAIDPPSNADLAQLVQQLVSPELKQMNSPEAQRQLSGNLSTPAQRPGRSGTEIG